VRTRTTAAKFLYVMAEQEIIPMKGLLIAGVLLATAPAYSRVVRPLAPSSDAISVQWTPSPSPSTLFQLREDQRQQQAADERRKREEGTTIVHPSPAMCAGHPEWIICQHR
jgi:hypothetical protein